MAGTMENYNGYETKSEINNLIKEYREILKPTKQQLRFESVKRDAYPFDTSGVDWWDVVKLEDKDWNTALYMKEQGKGKDTYYKLKFYKKEGKFWLWTLYWEQLWVELQYRKMPGRFLTLKETDLILQKFEKCIELKKDAIEALKLKE